MSTETAETSAVAPTVAPTPAKDGKCGMGDRHIHRDDLWKIWRECQSESFWYRALPLSLTSMGITGALIYNGTWQASKRFGPVPKLALAGILGFAVGKASYASTCRQKFERLGPNFGPGFGPGFGPWSRRPDFAPGHRHCHHVCEECKRHEAQAAAPVPASAPAQPAQS